MVLRLTCFEQFFDTRKTLGDIVTGNTAGVERTHGELCTRFTDGLSSDDTNCFTDFNFSLVSQVTAIALDADAEL